MKHQPCQTSDPPDQRPSALAIWIAPLAQARHETPFHDSQEGRLRPQRQPLMAVREEFGEAHRLLAERGVAFVGECGQDRAGRPVDGLLPRFEGQSVKPDERGSHRIVKSPASKLPFYSNSVTIALAMVQADASIPFPINRLMDIFGWPIPCSPSNYRVASSWI